MTGKENSIRPVCMYNWFLSFLKYRIWESSMSIWVILWKSTVLSWKCKHFLVLNLPPQQCVISWKWRAVFFVLFCFNTDSLEWRLLALRGPVSQFEENIHNFKILSSGAPWGVGQLLISKSQSREVNLNFYLRKPHIPLVATAAWGTTEAEILRAFLTIADVRKQLGLFLVYLIADLITPSSVKLHLQI